MQREVTSNSNVAQIEEESHPVTTLTITAETTPRKVKFSEDTVDNENMNRKSSKCCCVYRKEKKFGEPPSDSSDSDCDGKCWMGPKEYHKNCIKKKCDH